MISLKGVTYKYIIKDENGDIKNTKTAINNLSLSIDSGSFVCIVGRNGSGKSTLARIMKGLLEPSIGEVQISDDISMVFQNPDNQIIASIVEEDVAFGLENMCVESKEIEKRVTKALEVVKMLDHRFASPNKLSGGQKQKVAIAGAIALNCKYLILDEPTAMLDPRGREEIIDTLYKLNKEENITIILITHYMDEVVDCDRLIIMDDGNIVEDDKPINVFSKGKELEKYDIELPYVANLSYEINKDGFNINKNTLRICDFIDQIVNYKK
ncbi:MAG: ATP-binding cassette domain-containing protein [Eubacteriales bacterium]|nr:ATP-binding cassette domain-containing protein [Eubacteriales bacterium]